MRTLRWFLLVVLFISNNVFAEVVQISTEQLKQLLASDVTIIDVRTPGEWKQTGVVEGSHLIMFFNEKRQPLTEQWMQQTSELISPDQELILICRSGNRSGMIANYLSKQHQFVRVYNVQKGIKDWIAKGNKTLAVE